MVEEAVRGKGWRWAESWEQRALVWMHVFKKPGERKALRRSVGRKEKVGREKEEVNSSTVEEKEGRKGHSKVNDAGKDETEKKEGTKV